MTNTISTPDIQGDRAAEIELLPCPFCGRARPLLGVTRVWCENCGATVEASGARWSDEHLAAAWNTRAGADLIKAQAEEIQRLRAGLEIADALATGFIVNGATPDDFETLLGDICEVVRSARHGLKDPS